VLHLQGRSDELVKTLRRDCAGLDALRFEDPRVCTSACRRCKKPWQAAYDVHEKQRDEDIFGYYRCGGIRSRIQTLNVRSGQLWVAAPIRFRVSCAETEVLSSFINQYYADNPTFPRSAGPCELEDADSLAKLSVRRRDARCRPGGPRRVISTIWSNWAMKNAELSYQKDAMLTNNSSAPSRSYRINCISVRRHIVLNVLIFPISVDSARGFDGLFPGGPADKQRYRRYVFKRSLVPTTTA